MSKTEISKFQRILDAQVVELTFSIRQRDAIAIEQSPEDLDRRLRASERELAMQNLESQSLKLREARAALRRIQDGSYGFCLECEEPIGAKRLAAVPAAPLCIRCQQAMDCRCGAKSARHVLAMAA